MKLWKLLISKLNCNILSFVLVHNLRLVEENFHSRYCNYLLDNCGRPIPRMKLIHSGQIVHLT